MMEVIKNGQNSITKKIKYTKICMHQKLILIKKIFRFLFIFLKVKVEIFR